MQWLLFACLCLLAAQCASAVRVAAVPNKQFVQFSVAYKGKTCADFKDSNTAEEYLRYTVGPDAVEYLRGRLPDLAFNSITDVVDTKCFDWTKDGTSFASVRTAITWTGVDTPLQSTSARDGLIDAFRKGACHGGYDRNIYAMLADAVRKKGLTVAYNRAVGYNPHGKKGWIDYVTAENCHPDRSPSPAPESPSPAPTDGEPPSPEPESPSPDPSTP